MRRIGIALFAAVAVLSLAALVGARTVGAEAIARAPNHGGARAELAPPADVGRLVRAEVGPPVAELEAWVLDPDGAPRGTTLVLHGIRDDKRSMVDLGRALRDAGLRAVLVDLRGHGGSTGEWLTYGALEGRDLAQLVDQLDALGMIEGPLSVYGPSYGGAAALQLAALDPRVSAVVGVSTFASLRDVVPPYAALHWGSALLPGALLDVAIDAAGELGGFAPDAADSRAAIARVRARVLLIHGDADRHIPLAQARALLTACPRGRCELVTVDGGDHAGTLGSERTRAEALRFLLAGAERHASR